ncbi:MAG: 6-phosphofructokinase, partial [Chloroflexi bacterium]|nr:6-phosphofructokinase [Chloroflexota bacterium]
AERFDPEELAALAGIEVNRDPHGHIRLGELPLSAMLRRAIQQRFADAGKNLGMVDVTIGYELRCASPLSFDIDYTRSLGYGAARLLLSAPEDDRFANGGLIYLDGEKLSTLTFDELRDPDTGRTRVRMVDTDSERYKVAQQYMVRIQPEDLQDDALVSEMAAYGNRSPEEVRERFGDSDS